MADNLPKATPGELRKLVRVVLALSAGYWKNEDMLSRGLSRLLGFSVDLTDMRSAVEWNIAAKYVSHRINPDTDDHEWNITAHGLAKEAV